MEKYYEKCNKIMFPHGFVSLGNPGYIFPLQGISGEDIQSLSSLVTKNDDIFLAGLEKTGTSWLSEAVWVIRNGVDLEKARLFRVNTRVPVLMIGVVQLETGLELGIRELESLIPTVAQINEMENRTLKSHLPLSLFPTEWRNKKIIYTARHPKDACLSLYHFSVSFQGYTGSLDDFVDAYINGAVPYLPYWSHVKEAWARRNDSNFLFLTYEEMKKDLGSVLVKIADFVGVKLSESQLNQAVNHLSFEQMKDNPSVNYDPEAKHMANVLGLAEPGKFMRSGTVGKWKSEMTASMVQKFDKWIAENNIPGLFEA